MQSEKKRPIKWAPERKNRIQQNMEQDYSNEHPDFDFQEGKRHNPDHDHDSHTEVKETPKVVQDKEEKKEVEIQHEIERPIVTTEAVPEAHFKVKGKKSQKLSHHEEVTQDEEEEDSRHANHARHDVNASQLDLSYIMMLQEQNPQLKLVVLSTVGFLVLVFVLLVAYFCSYNVTYNIRAIFNSFFMGIFWTLFVAYSLTGIDIIYSLQHQPVSTLLLKRLQQHLGPLCHLQIYVCMCIVSIVDS